MQTRSCLKGLVGLYLAFALPLSSLEFHHNFSGEGYLKLISSEEGERVEIGFFSELPEAIASFKDKFQSEKGSFSYHYPAPHSSDFTFPHFPLPPRSLPSAQPKNLSPLELKAYFDCHSVLFYTGAGISSAAGIPTAMEMLHSLNPGSTELERIASNILKHPQDALVLAKKFTEICHETDPTLAHKVLAELSKAPILTENVDRLHEKCGSKTVRFDEGTIEMLKKSDFTSIDAIVCVGLRIDHRGFLAHYKKANPSGIIIAINTIQPDYLGDLDFLCLGNCQKTLLSLKTN